MNRRRFLSALWLAGVLAPAASAAPAQGIAVPLVNASSPAAGWVDSWGDIPSGAAALAAGAKLKVQGTLSNQSYGCVYKPVEIDLDRTPYMEIDVESASHHWYVILRGGQLPNGWVKVQPDTDQTGAMMYDLRLATGLTGRQKFDELQLGISTEGGASGNKGQTLLINSLRLLSASAGGDALELYGPKNRKLSGWKNLNDDKSPSGVDMLPGDKSAAVRANRAGQSYGMMYKAVNLDLDRFSVLKVDVESSTHHWYVILTHPSLDKGFARIQPDTNLTGTFHYDLADLTGLSGVKDVRLQFGVSTNEQSPSALGETVVLKEISFLAPSQLPAGAKLFKKKDLTFQQKVQAVAAKPVKTLKDPAAAAVRAEGVRAPSASKPVSSAAGADLLPGLGDELAAPFAPKVSAAGKTPTLKEVGQELVVDNGLYRLAFSKANGALLSLQQAGAAGPLLVGSLDSSLWKIDTRDRATLDAADQAFAWTWDGVKGRLALTYESKKIGSTVRVFIDFDASDKIKMTSDVVNRSEKTFLSFSLPQGLLFNTADLDRVVLPRLVGVAYKPGFFKANRQWADPYPPAFADFAWVGTRHGALTVYMVQPEGAFQPATLEIGGAHGGEKGAYNHRIAAFVQPGETWKTPALYLLVGRGAEQTVRDYARDNGLDRTPSLEKKLGAALAGKLNRALFLKVDQSANVDIASVMAALADLPANLVFHLAAFWPGGFDKNYPDYLPPDAQYGTLADFKKLVAAARARGMLAMPYTNPTWWNEGPTLKKLGAERIGTRELDGVLRAEAYNGNPGFVVAPQHPRVLDVHQRTLGEFTKDVPMDFLFHDQLGARRWLYQAEIAKPLDYTDALIRQAARESVKIPLMTEGGFDRLMAHEAGFCGMTSMSYPAFKEYDDLWGAGNWEIHPISLYLAHEKVNFYQHNLSDDVLADDPAKIAWNLVHGFGLNAARTFIRQNTEKEWIALGAGLHEHVLSRVLGKPLLGYRRVSPAVTWSRFGDVDVFANLSAEAPLSLGDHAVAPEGFLARSRNGDLLAGRFAKMNGAAVEGAPFVVVKSRDKEIDVLQPGEGKTTFLTLARPAAWTSDAAIRAFREDGAPVPLSVEGDRLTFLYRADAKPARVFVRYAPAADAVAVALSPAEEVLRGPGPLRVEVAFTNGDAAALPAAARLSAWIVRADEGLPPLADAKGRKSPGETVALPSVPGKGALAAAFLVDVPPTAFLNGRCLWLRAEAEYGAGSRRKAVVLERRVILGK